MTWTHNICDLCWDELHPNRAPTRLMLDDEPVVCCFCGEQTGSGIFIRHDPKTLKFCKCED